MTLQSDNATAVTISFSVGTDDANGHAGAISAFNAQSAKTGVTASYDSKNGGIKLTHADGNDIKLKNTTTGAAATDAVVATYTTAGAKNGTAVDTSGANGATAMGQITMNSDKSFSVADANTTMALNGNSTLNSVADLDISTFDGAQAAIRTADAALAAVNSQRAEYGALQSRFESAISNLGSSTENLSASRSRIVDTDFAAETAKMTRGQILQQAGTSMLAQANSLPNGVLSLLRG